MLMARVNFIVQEHQQQQGVQGKCKENKAQTFIGGNSEKIHC